MKLRKGHGSTKKMGGWSPQFLVDLSADFLFGRCRHVPELLSITELGELSSLHEDFPNAVLEYMAAGCLVVATDVGGVHEAVVDGGTGYLVEARDHEAMARQILRLLDAPRRAREMGILGQKIVKQ